MVIGIDLTGTIKAKIVIEKAPDKLIKLPNLGITIESNPLSITITVLREILLI
jgi:hypothetical protein